MVCVTLTVLYCVLNFFNLMLTMTDCCSGKLGMVKKQFSVGQTPPDLEGGAPGDGHRWSDKNVTLLLNILARTCGLPTVMRCLATISNDFHNTCCPAIIKDSEVSVGVGTNVTVKIKLNNFLKNLVKSEKRTFAFALSGWFERLTLTHTLELESKSVEGESVQTAIFKKLGNNEELEAQIKIVKDDSNLIIRTYVNDITLSLLKVEKRP